jgi:hypothetical protein
MRRRIRDLDFGAIVDRIVRSVNVATREVGDPSSRATLAFIKTPADAVRRLRGRIANAAASEVSTPDELSFERGLVEAFVRMSNHPLATPGLGSVRANQGPDMAPRLLEIAAAHPEAKFDLSAVQQALVRAVLAHGDHELDDKELPWFMHWNGASAAAGALFLFVTLERLGDIVVDEHEEAEYNRDLEHFDRSKVIPPSKLVK